VNSVSIENREVLLKLFVILSIKTTIGYGRQKQLTVHVNSIGANRMMNENAVVGTGRNPRKNGTGGSIHNHVSGVMDITIKILPSGTLTQGRKSRMISKKGRETGRIGKAGTLM
jgi:hypothetical protein